MGQPAEAMRVWGVIRLHRQRGFWRDHFGAYQVRIDDHRVGSIVEGETKDFSVPPGEHRVRLSMDRFWTSREVAVQIGEDEHAEFVCRPAASVIVSMVLIWLRPRGYIRLDGPIGDGRT
jgi:hypothetical protein